eukprot:3638500-Rhodomonas_salina.1
MLYLLDAIKVAFAVDAQGGKKPQTRVPCQAICLIQGHISGLALSDLTTLPRTGTAIAFCPTWSPMWRQPLPSHWPFT